MTFLNATLLAGVLAAAVPILLHLVARRQPKRVVFSSIHFLTKRFESNRSKIRVRRWWLLAMRIVALAAVALALARPTIDRSVSTTWIAIALIAIAAVALAILASVAAVRGGNSGLTVGLASAAGLAGLASIGMAGYTWAAGPKVSLLDRSPVAIAILIDNSPTSTWRDDGDQRLRTMNRAAAQLVSRLPPTSRVAVLGREATPATFSLDAAGAISKIESTRATLTPAPIASRIDAAVRLLRTSDLDSRLIVVLTDRGETSWPESVAEAGLVAALNSPDSMPLTIVAGENFATPNVVLSPLEASDLTPAAGIDVAVSANVSIDPDSLPVEDTADADDSQDASEETSRSVAVELQVFENRPGLPVVRDETVVTPPLRGVDRVSVNVDANRSAEVVLNVPGLPLGTHHVVIRASGNDPLAIDDVRYLSLEVVPPPPVLLVGDDEEKANVIRRAIAVSASGDDAEQYFVERVGYEDVGVVDLTGFDVVVMLDPPADSLRSPRLTEYVRGGGNLLVASGRALTESVVQGGQPIAPALLPAIQRLWRTGDQPTFFEVADLADPITEPVRRDTPWSDFPVSLYWQVEPDPAIDSVLVRYAGTKHPALISRGFPGGGRLLLWTTPIPELPGDGQRWNRLFGIDPWPVWLLLRGAVDSLSGHDGGELNATVGGSVSLPIGPELADDETSAGRFQWFPPGGRPPVPIDVARGSNRLVIGRVDQPGTSWIRGGLSTGFSTNLDPDAISLAQVENETLRGYFAGAEVEVVESVDDLDLDGGAANAAVPLFSPLMLVALLAFILELVLQNRFYR